MAYSEKSKDTYKLKSDFVDIRNYAEPAMAAPDSSPGSDLGAAIYTASYTIIIATYLATYV